MQSLAPGKVLSRYLVSAGNFTHPVSRRPLSRDECVALDSYMIRLGLGDAAVCHAFDLKVMSIPNFSFSSCLPSVSSYFSFSSFFHCFAEQSHSQSALHVVLTCKGIYPVQILLLMMMIMIMIMHLRWPQLIAGLLKPESTWCAQALLTHSSWALTG